MIQLDMLILLKREAPMTDEFSTSTENAASPMKLPPWTKLAYGAGDMGAGMTSNLIAFSFLIFLTEVAGINPLAAGTVLLIGKVWDAVNDPLVGVLSDRTQTRWGRRYPWILLSALPFGITFFLMWLVPSGSSGFRFWYYVVTSILFQIFFTTANLPYTTLTAELTQDYDERTDLTSFRLGFSLVGAILALALGLVVTGQIENEVLQYTVLGGTCAVLSVIPLLVCVFGTYPQAQRAQAIATQADPGETETEIPFWEPLSLCGGSLSVCLARPANYRQHHSLLCHFLDGARLLLFARLAGTGNRNYHDVALQLAESQTGQTRAVLCRHWCLADCADGPVLFAAGAIWVAIWALRSSEFWCGDSLCSALGDAARRDRTG